MKNFKLFLQFLSVIVFVFLQQNPYHADDEKSKPWHEKKRYVFLVGINKYKNTTELKYAVKDSREMYKLFSQVGHFEKIFMLNDLDGKVIVTKGKEESRDKQYLPTKANIEATYKSILAEKPDTLVFYYSGHGFIDGKDDKNSIAPMDVEVEFVKEKAVAKNGIVLTEMANGFKTEAEKAKEADKGKSEIDQVIFLIDACRSPLPKADAEEAPTHSKKELGKDDKTKAANSGKPEPSKEIAKEIPKEEPTKELISFQNYGEEIPQIVKDAKGVVILIGTSPNESSLEDESIESGKFTYYMRKAISGGIQDETPAEYVTLESLELFVKKKFDLEQLEYEKVERERGNGEISQSKPKQAVYKVSTQRGFTGDFLITYGRPPESEVRVERRGYMDTSEERPVAAKVLFNKNKERYDLKFFAKSKDTGKYYPESLEGISRMKYAFDRNKMGDLQGFTAEQYNYNEEPVYTHGLELDEENGWEFTSLYPLTEEDKKDKDKKRIRFQRQKFDFNGNNILQEYFDDKGKPVAIGSAEITKTIRAWDYNGEKTLEEFYNAKGELTNNEYGYARYTASYLGKGKPVSEEYFGSDGKLSGNQTGIARKTFTYDPGYKLVSQQNFDKEGKRIGDKDEVAVTNYTYNDACVNRIWNLESSKEIYQESDDKAKSELTEKFKRKEAYADCIETEVYLDKSEKSKARPSGIAKKENQFNDKGLKKLEQYFRHDERPWHKGGIFRTVYTYDDKDRVTAKKYFGETRNTTLDPVPVTDERGIHEYRYQYGTTGGGKYQFGYKKELLERVTYYGVDGKLVSTAEGISIEEHLFTYNRERKDYEESIVHYLDEKEDLVKGNKSNSKFSINDKNGNIVLKEFFGQDGKWKGDHWGIARYVYKYDEKGNKLLQETYGTDGKLEVYGDARIARYVFKYDEKGNIILEETYRADGILKDYISTKYDEKRNEILRELYNAEGKLFYKYMYKYDEKGNKVLEETYGEDAKLRIKFVYKYDEKGNKLLEEAYREDGKLFFKYVYDEKGNKLLEEIYREDGKLIDKYVQKYDEKGNKLLQETYGEDGNIKERLSLVYKYDEKGKKVLEETYGTDGNLKERFVYKYNEKEKKVLEETYGTDGNLKERFVYKYNEKENMLSKETYGADEKLIDKYLYKYDEKGNKVLEETYGADGKLKEKFTVEVVYRDDEEGNNLATGYIDSVARYVYKYDEKGNKILEEQYRADGKTKYEYLDNNTARVEIEKEFSEEWKQIHTSLLDALKEKEFNKELSTIEKQISVWKKEYRHLPNLEKKLTDSLGQEKGKKLFNEYNDFVKKFTKELENCTLRKVSYRYDGTLAERKERFDRYHPLTTEKPDANGVLESPEYHLYFPNPRGQFEKRLLHLKLDRFYRPVGLEFEKR